ncbi:60S ribosomal export protein NMD3 [Culicoides brevitarsis]|uniref:60S ribosomal export protein NMD3 n=1 Tax=Culicoides brevitarsis TaxID=469753 RepID=UPI00307B29CA
MEYMSTEGNPQTSGSGVNKILCCECGVDIEPNPANMCVACLRTHVDITEGIPKQAVLHFCRNCERYLQPPMEWVKASLESRELLAVCIKKLKGLKDVKLVDAGFVWTEPHSKRIKVKLTVHGQVMGGTVLQQIFVVEFTVQNQMCDDCHRTEAKDFWQCVVQVRQKAINKKTLFYLEQMILKHRAHENTIGIKPAPNGMDFFYHTDSHARKMVDFISSVLPIKLTTAKKLISQDIHSNIYNYKFTYAIEVVPVSKGSLVCLNKKQQQHLGSISPICLIQRVGAQIHLIDPLTAQMAEITGMAYWKSPFESICNPKQLVEFIVMDLEYVQDKDRNYFPGQGPVSHKHVLSDIWLVKASELGVNENTIHTRTHIGHLLKVGDSVMCYDLSEANINNADFEKLKSDKIPDVIVVKKHYGDKSVRKRMRNWKLKHLVDEPMTDTDGEGADYNEFLEDLEEDPTLRQNVNIFKDSKKQIPVDTNDMDDQNAPRVTLEEMLDDLVIGDDVEMGDE